MLERFIVFINQHQTEACCVIIHTQGGDRYISETMVHMINKMPSVSIIIQAAYSAGFDIAFNARCPKFIGKGVKGMLHLSRVEVSINSKAKPYFFEDECCLLNLPAEHRRDDALAKKVMTPKELNAYRRGDEVYFSFRRMREIFPDAKIL